LSAAGPGASHDAGTALSVRLAMPAGAWLNDIIRSNSTEPGRLPGAVTDYKVNIYG